MAFIRGNDVPLGVGENRLDAPSQKMREIAIKQMGGMPLTASEIAALARRQKSEINHLDAFNAGAKSSAAGLMDDIYRLSSAPTYQRNLAAADAGIAARYGAQNVDASRALNMERERLALSNAYRGAQAVDLQIEAAKRNAAIRDFEFGLMREKKEALDRGKNALADFLYGMDKVESVPNAVRDPNAEADLRRAALGEAAQMRDVDTYGYLQNYFGSRDAEKQKLLAQQIRAKEALTKDDLDRARLENERRRLERQEIEYVTAPNGQQFARIGNNLYAMKTQAKNKNNRLQRYDEYKIAPGVYEDPVTGEAVQVYQRNGDKSVTINPQFNLFRKNVRLMDEASKNGAKTDAQDGPDEATLQEIANSIGRIE